MHMEFQDPIKGSSSSSAPSAIPSAPQQDYYGAGNNFNYQKPPPSSAFPSAPQQDYGAGNNFNYQQPPPPPTMGIPVNVMHNSSHQQPPLFAPVPWSTGLCGCTDDWCSCCQTFWCPCITFGQIAEITDKGATSCGLSGSLYALILYLTGCAFCYSCFYRSKLRAEYSLEEGTCPDCCVHFWCESCALCQEYRELKNRGFDMAIGWHGNMDRQMRRQSAAPPMFQQPMHR